MNHRSRRWAVAAWALVGAGGCGTEPLPPPQPPNPVPALRALEPDTALTETDSATVSIVGAGFLPTSTVLVESAARAPTFINSTELRLTLTRFDLASPTAFDLRVRNAAPGGGTSPPARFRVVYPKPAITGVQPLEVDGPNGRDVAVTGTYFSALSTVLFDGQPAERTSFTSTTSLIARVPDGLSHQVGTRVVHVVNPPPGGGTSAPDSLRVVYGAPEISSLTPTPVWRGRPLRMVLAGKRIRSTTVLRWNGQSKPLIGPGYTGALVDFSGDDFGPPGIASVALETPGPFGGTSTPVSVTVYGEPPKHLSVSPSAVAASGGPLTVTIHGIRMVRPVQVLAHSSPRPFRLIDSSTLEVDLAAGDLAGPQPVQLFVHYPVFVNPANTDPEILAVRVLAPSDPVRDFGTVNLTATDIAADPVGGTVYAAVAANMFSFGNQLVAIDPTSRGVVWTLPIRPGASRLGISDDGVYLYIASSLEPVVDRVHLPTRRIDLTLPVSVGGTDWLATDLVPLVGAPRSVVVGYAGGAVVFDDDRRRPAGSAGAPAPTWLTRTGAADLVYGINASSGATELARLRVSATGIATERIDVVPNATGKPWIDFAGGRLFDGGGIVIDPVGWTGIASLGVSGPLRADAPTGRVHYLQVNQLISYDATTLAKLGEVAVTGAGGSTRLVRWGPDGLAIGGGEGSVITILRTANVRP